MSDDWIREMSNDEWFCSAQLFLIGKKKGDIP